MTSNRTLFPSEKLVNIASTDFIIDKRFNNLKLIGKGSYGVVCSAYDTSANFDVAIKKISHISSHASDAKHVLRGDHFFPLSILSQ